jgi:hypothetical protein
MSMNWIYLLFGGLLVTLWGIGLKRGIVFGNEPVLGLPFSTHFWVHRELQPFKFWLIATIYGAIAFAVLGVSVGRLASGA